MIDFTAQTQTSPALVKLLRDPKTLEERVLILKKLWSRRYNLPLNDPRLLSLTVRELTEETALEVAWVQVHETDTTITEGEEGAAIADQPLVTGDPVFDQMERDYFAGKQIE
jgi:hypothetical protein